MIYTIIIIILFTINSSTTMNNCSVFIIKIFLAICGHFLFINRGHMLYILIALPVYILLKSNTVIHLLLSKIQFVINKRICCSTFC